MANRYARRRRLRRSLVRRRAVAKSRRLVGWILDYPPKGFPWRRLVFIITVVLFGLAFVAVRFGRLLR